VPDYSFKVSTVPEFLVREAGVPFTLGLSEEEILSRLANSEKVVLVALYVRAMRMQSFPEELVDKKIQAFSGKKISKRGLVKALVQLVMPQWISLLVLNLLSVQRTGSQRVQTTKPTLHFF
jgi:hypothetical protein